MRNEERNNSNKSQPSSSASISMLLLELAAIFVIVILAVGILAKLTNVSPPLSESDASSSQVSGVASNITEENSSNFDETTLPDSESMPDVTKQPESTSKTEETTSVQEDSNTVPKTEDSSIPPDTSEAIPPEESEPVGTIYLTFDDGPSLKTTGRILDILKEKNVKATFFILDYSYGSEKEKLILREFNEGHTIGLHGTSHEYSKIYTSLEVLVKNFDTLRDKVITTTGATPFAIRFPGGSSNTVSKNYCKGIMTQAVEYFNNETDYSYFDWNIDSRDAGGVKSAEELYENVISGLRAGKNNVILMHDSSNKEFTVSALSAIIDYALSEGYEFKAITSDMPQVTHKVAN